MKTKSPTNGDTPIIEVKKVKHTFTSEERLELHEAFLNARDSRVSAEAEFDGVKASYKAKITTAEAKEAEIASTLRAGFELRETECRVRYFPDKREKRYWLKEDPEEAPPVHTEPMTADDFQAELLHAERNFERREEIDVFQPSGQDRGVIVVGRLKGRWYSAVRISIGKHSLGERLDSEQPSTKQRYDAILVARKRLEEWMKVNLKADAKGFEEPIAKAVESQKEREE